MTVGTAVRWWPLVGAAALLLLGWSVGAGMTAVDRPVYRSDVEPAALRQHWLLFFTDWRVLVSVLTLCMIVALRRRWWRAAVAVVVCPATGLLGVDLLKQLFDRDKDGALAYPSGHSTQVVIAMSLLVMIVSARLWVVALAATVSLLGMIGMVAVGYHYMTDTIGGALLGTTIVCLAAQLAGSPPRHLLWRQNGSGAADSQPDSRPRRQWWMVRT